MDKLKPIITHRFWILTGLILILAVYGYFSANGAIKAATTARETELSGVISGIPTGQSPNASYSENLKFINTKLESMVEDVIVGLWKKQTERMTWPVVMEGKIPHNFMTTNPGTTFTVESGFVYKSVYENEVLENLMLSVEPVHPLLEQKIIPADRKQKVVLMPDVPRIRLGTMAVKPSDVWDAQIDVWLTSLIFDAIRATNADTDTVSEAVVRRIDKYWLFGGTGTPLLPGVMGAGMMGGYEGAGGYEGTAGDMPGGGYEGAAGAAAGAGPGAMMDSGGMGMMGAMGMGLQTIQSSVAFNPAEEFGSDAGAAPAMAGGGGYEGAGMPGGYEGSADAAADGMGMFDSMGMMGMMGGAMGGPRIRYIADEETKPFLERGFYLSVIILQSKIPEFLTELASSPWPIRVKRFSLGDNPYRKKDAFGSYGMGPMAYGGGYGGAYGGAMGGYEGDMMGGMMDGGTAGGMPYEGDMGMLGGMTGGYGDFGYGAMGGMMGGMMGGPMSTKSRFSAGLPPFATEAMNSPELVQLDLCGVITMYKQPQSLRIPEAAPEAAAGGEGTDAATAPAGEATPADPAATPPVETTTPEVVPAAESAAPAETPPAAEAPPATPAP